MLINIQTKKDHRSTQPGSLFDPDQRTLTLKARYYINLSAEISAKSQQSLLVMIRGMIEKERK